MTHWCRQRYSCFGLIHERRAGFANFLMLSESPTSDVDLSVGGAVIHQVHELLLKGGYADAPRCMRLDSAKKDVVRKFRAVLGRKFVVWPKECDCG